MKRTITAIIVEDEKYPRLSLFEKLNTYHPNIQVLDMCADCDTALESILKHKPDLLFLDIELPGKNSLWLVERLKETSSLPIPYIIFTTAFNDSEYLLKAIKLEAADYLIKPIALEELALAIKKVMQKIETDKTVAYAMTQSASRTFTLRTHNSLLHLKDSDIICFEADSYCSKLLLANGNEELIFERLGDIERKLFESKHIIRTGRKYLINCNHVYKLNIKNNSCSFQLISGKVVEKTLSENGMSTLMQHLSISR